MTSKCGRTAFNLSIETESETRERALENKKKDSKVSMGFAGAPYRDSRDYHRDRFSTAPEYRHWWLIPLCPLQLEQLRAPPPPRQAVKEGAPFDHRAVDIGSHSGSGAPHRAFFLCKEVERQFHLQDLASAGNWAGGSAANVVASRIKNKLSVRLSPA